MINKIYIQHQSAVSNKTGSALHTTTTAAETLALTMMGTVAVTSVVIGAWSTLAFAGALAGNGPVALVSGFIGAVAGF